MGFESSHAGSVELDETGVVAERGRLLGVLVAPAEEFMVEARCRPWLLRENRKRWRILVAFSESLRSMVEDGGGLLWLLIVAGLEVGGLFMVDFFWQVKVGGCFEKLSARVAQF